MSKAEQEIFGHLTYASYYFNRFACGMTVEAGKRLYKDADAMEVKYQRENQPTPAESGQEKVA
jgi:hypothetical protein